MNWHILYVLVIFMSIICITISNHVTSNSAEIASTHQNQHQNQQKHLQNVYEKNIAAFRQANGQFNMIHRRNAVNADKRSNWEHISTSYAPKQTLENDYSATKQEIPTYEAQQENIYGTETPAEYVYTTKNNQEQQQFQQEQEKQQEQQQTFYNLQANAEQNNFAPYWMPLVRSEAPQQTHFEGNSANAFQHNYEHQQVDINNSNDETQQQFTNTQYYNVYDDYGRNEHQMYSQLSHEKDSESTEQTFDEATNYLHGGGSSSSSKDTDTYEHPDIINYVPYPVVKKLHIPVRQQIQIPISHAILMPISKPVPIHIPITKQVQIPVEKQLKVPVERVVPYPVEKHVPVPVEKRVPYQVVKYVPVKVPHPFPIKVPVYKTILHKIKSLWK